MNNSISLNKPQDGTWDGELWTKGLSLQQLSSLVSPKHPRSDHFVVNYNVFDHVELDDMIDRIPAASYVESSFVRCVETIDCYSVADVERQLDKFIKYGYEGIIIRHPHKPYISDSRLWMMKLKPVKQIQAVIIDYKEERTQDGQRKGTLGAIECQLAPLVGSNLTPVTFWVGSGFTAFQRSDYWDDPVGLIGRIAIVKFQDYTDSGVPYFTRIVKIL